MTASACPFRWGRFFWGQVARAFGRCHRHDAHEQRLARFQSQAGQKTIPRSAWPLSYRLNMQAMGMTARVYNERGRQLRRDPERLSPGPRHTTTRKFGMKTILSIMGATALLASAASAAPSNPTAVGTPEASNIEQVRVVCNQFGRCWRTAVLATSTETTTTATAAIIITEHPGTTRFRGTAIIAAAPALGSVLEAARRWVNIPADFCEMGGPTIRAGLPRARAARPRLLDFSSKPRGRALDRSHFPEGDFHP